MTLLQARGVTLERPGRRVLDDVNLELRSGEMLGIIGPNGAGKSSLLRVLAGIEAANAGTVLADGEDLRALSPRSRAQRLGYHAQQPELHWPLQVRTIIALGRLPHAHSLAALGARDEVALAAAIARTALEPLLDRRGDSLSGGELARVHIARLLAGEHRCLLADEPTANLDPRFQMDILHLLRAHARSGGGCIVVLHDLNAAARHCDRLIMLKDGRVHTSGAPREVLTADAVARVFDVSKRYFVDAGLAQAMAADGAATLGPSAADS